MRHVSVATDEIFAPAGSEYHGWPQNSKNGIWEPEDSVLPDEYLHQVDANGRAMQTERI